VTQTHIFGLLLFGFGILVSLWPFHSWAPLGYGAAPSSAAMLHAGVLKSSGLYGLLQIALPLLPFGAAQWSHSLAVVAGVGNVLAIGLVTMAQRDLKQMVGYSSVMHMVTLSLGSRRVPSWEPAALSCSWWPTAFSVALLFLLSTTIYHARTPLRWTRWAGLRRRPPCSRGCSWRRRSRA